MKPTPHYVFAVLVLILSPYAPAETDTVVILHTNDLHDHVRPGYEGAGGLAYVSGYIRSVKASRPDVLVVDGGDVMEKGDMVVYETQSRVMYEAMTRAGYHVAVPGNHDDAYGIPHLEECVKLAKGVEFVCINWFQPNGELIFPASTIVDVDGVKVGVIGYSRERDEHSMPIEETAEAVAREAERLEPDVDLTVVVCHEGSRTCRKVSKAAPLVDVFVSGHTHERIRRPYVVEETGALIVQAGDYANFVGRLELAVDLETEDVEVVQYDLIEMDHEEIEPDAKLAGWFRDLERELTPDASRVVTHFDGRLTRSDLGRIGAAALREAAGADIGFCHSGQIIRDDLPHGPVDVNAIFRTGGQRGEDNVTLTLTGADIETYINGLAETDWGPTQWSGFQAQRGEDGRYETNLEAQKRYSVIISVKEWETRFTRLFGRRPGLELSQPVKAIATNPVPNTFTSAVVAYIEALDKTDVSLEDRANALRETTAP